MATDIVDMPSILAAAEMGTLRIVKPARDGAKYSHDEVKLILSVLPTIANAKMLAHSLERTTNAIRFIHNMAYSGKWLKDTLANKGCQDPGAENIHKLVGIVKKELGISIGHMPK